ncbi:hypothetical protein [Variovorax sp. SRS16]|uniref:hypothetical protein n=1 Tax=Variovorax sp. SRS16 TaxID=282217 RepID=UPI001E3960D8|nr:hypothetical protein [Variovorax sp. SRS16]
MTWKRNIGFSQTTLALLTALVAVIGAVLPAVKLALTPSDSKITGVILATDSELGIVSALVNNEGAKQGAVTGAQISVTRPQGKVLEVGFDAVEKPTIIPNEKAIEVKFRIKGATISRDEPLSDDDLAKNPRLIPVKCEFTLFVTTGKGITEHTQTPCEALHVMGIFLGQKDALKLTGERELHAEDWGGRQSIET